ncbi:MAG: hypothetical protein ACRELB_22090 [Polyangiaceae bacterium]
MSNKRHQRIRDLADRLHISHRAAANILDSGGGASPPQPPRLSQEEIFHEMNYGKERVTFSSDNRAPTPALSILFGGRRYVESEFVEAVDDVVQQAARDERRFWQVMTSGRSIVRYVWDRMQREPALKVAWAARWLAAAEEFASLQETWGERPDRFWR